MRFPPRRSMICCPNCRSRIPSRASLRILFENTPQIAFRRIGVHTQQQVGRGKMENTEGVGLHNLRHIKDAAKFIRSGRNAHRQQRITRFGGSNQMADRANAANPRHQRWHFGERAPLAEFFKAAELRDMETRIRNFPCSSRCSVIFAWPSMRVTGSITMVLFFRHRLKLRSAFSHSTRAAVRPAIHPQHRKSYRRKADNPEQKHPLAQIHGRAAPGAASAARSDLECPGSSVTFSRYARS